MLVRAKPYPVHHILFWREYWVQMRPYLLFVSGAAGVSGMAMVFTSYTEVWRLYVGFIPFFLGYGFGQALTDCFQTDTDKLSAGYRPLSKGTVTVKSVMTVSIAGLGLCAAALLLLSVKSFMLSGLAVFGLYSYSYVKRRYTLIAPFYNAWIVALLPIMGFYAIQHGPEYGLNSQHVLHLATTFFSYSNFVLMGYLKDIEADRQTNYRTFPVIYGWKRTVVFGDILVILTLICFWLVPGLHTREVVVGLAATILVIYGQWKAHLARLHDPSSASQPILATVRGFLLFHLSIILHYQPNWWLYVIVFYLFFEWLLKIRPEKSQV